jgi:hypothetical protein
MVWLLSATLRLYRYDSVVAELASMSAERIRTQRYCTGADLDAKELRPAQSGICSATS